MKIQLSQRKTYVRRTIIFLLIYAFYGTLIKPHYATDTYAVFFNSDNGALQSARYVTYCFLRILDFMKINVVRTQSIWTAASILLLAHVTNMLIDRMLKIFRIYEFDTTYIILVIACLFSVVNISVLEWFLFPEVIFPYVLGIYLAIKAVLMFDDNTSSTKKYIIAPILVFLSIATYQINLCFFITFATIIAVLRNQMIFRKQCVIKIIQIWLIGAICGCVDILAQHIINKAQKVISSEREASITISSIWKNIVDILSQQREIFLKGSELIGPWLLILCISIVITLIICMYKTDLLTKLVISILLIGIYCVSYIFAIASPFIWLSPRVLVGIYIAISAAIIICTAFAQQNGTPKAMSLLLFIMIAFVGALYTNGNDIIADHYINNAVDQEYARQIYNAISQYENETGIEIHTISVADDGEIAWKNNGVQKMAYNVNERAFLNSWSDVTLINFVSNREFIRSEMQDEEKNKFFQVENWKQFDVDKQLYFENDTLYWIKY